MNKEIVVLPYNRTYFNSENNLSRRALSGVGFSGKRTLIYTLHIESLLRIALRKNICKRIKNRTGQKEIFCCSVVTTKTSVNPM